MTTSILSVLQHLRNLEQFSNKKVDGVVLNHRQTLEQLIQEAREKYNGQSSQQDAQQPSKRRACEPAQPSAPTIEEPIQIVEEAAAVPVDDAIPSANPSAGAKRKPGRRAASGAKAKKAKEDEQPVLESAAEAGLPGNSAAEKPAEVADASSPPKTRRGARGAPLVPAKASGRVTRSKKGAAAAEATAPQHEAEPAPPARRPVDMVHMEHGSQQHACNLAHAEDAAECIIPIRNEAQNPEVSVAQTPCSNIARISSRGEPSGLITQKSPSHTAAQMHKAAAQMSPAAPSSSVCDQPQAPANTANTDHAKPVQDDVPGSLEQLHSPFVQSSNNIQDANAASHAASAGPTEADLQRGSTVPEPNHPPAADLTVDLAAPSQPAATPPAGTSSSPGFAFQSLHKPATTPTHLGNKSASQIVLPDMTATTPAPLSGPATGTPTPSLRPQEECTGFGSPQELADAAAATAELHHADSPTTASLVQHGDQQQRDEQEDKQQEQQLQTPQTTLAADAADAGSPEDAPGSEAPADALDTSSEEQGMEETASEELERTLDGAHVSSHPVPTLQGQPTGNEEGDSGAAPAAEHNTATAGADTGTKEEKQSKTGNLVAAIRSFLPAKRPPSPQPAAGKKVVKVKALEQAQAARKVEEARAAEKARQKEVKAEAQSKVAAAAAPTSSIVAGDAAPAPGIVKQKAAAFMARIQDEEARRKEEVKKRVVEKEDHSRATPSTSTTLTVQQDAAGTNKEDGQAGARDAGAATATAGAVGDVGKQKVDVNDKLRRAELKRREDDERRKAELELRAKAKEERVKKVVQNKMALKAAASEPAAAKLKVAAAPAPAVAKPAASTAPAAVADTKDTAQQPVLATTKATAATATATAAHTTPAAGIKTAPGPGKVALNGAAMPMPHASALKTVGPKLPPADGRLPPPMTPAEVAEEERNVQALVNSPYVNTTVHRTPGARTAIKQPPKQPLMNYEISPYRSDSEDEYSPQASKKPIPVWALPANLLADLKAQQFIDPDKLFDTKFKTCNLEEIFAGVQPAPQNDHQLKHHKKRDWRKRGSSGNWIADRITWQEEINYKKGMGYL